MKFDSNIAIYSKGPQIKTSGFFNEAGSPFKTLFYSRANLNLIQAMIKNAVLKTTGRRISDQDETEILQIMRATDLRFSHNPLDPKLFQAEIDKLNGLVVEYSLPKIKSAIEQYINYLRDSQNPIRIGEMPAFSASKGENKIGEYKFA